MVNSTFHMINFLLFVWSTRLFIWSTCYFLHGQLCDIHIALRLDSNKMAANSEDAQHISSACAIAKQALEAIENLHNNDIRNVAALTATNSRLRLPLSHHQALRLQQSSHADFQLSTHVGRLQLENELRRVLLQVPCPEETGMDVPVKQSSTKTW